MAHKNVEFKASVNDLQVLEHRFQVLSPRYVGEDIQTDTYYQVVKGRLKLREGNIENALIWYGRENKSGARLSDIILYKHQPDDSLKQILTLLHGIKVVVRKVRRIYFIDNVKFHFDKVDGLGSFIEVEAIDNTGTFTEEYLHNQCKRYADFFGIKEEDTIAFSYSDLLMKKESQL